MSQSSIATRSIKDAAVASALAGRYLAFQLNGETFGIPITKVQEIVYGTAIVKIPNLPSHIRGITNLRGRIIAVVDLRTRLGLPSVTDSMSTCIVVTSGRETSGTQEHTGLVIDAVSEVIYLNEKDIGFSPSFGTDGDRITMGIGKVGNRVMMLLDLDEILGSC